MATYEDMPITLIEGAITLGRDLAAPEQTIAHAAGQLGVNLAVLGCEQDVDTNNIKGSWDSVFLRQNTPPFTRAVRMATSALIFREDSLVPAQAPENINLVDLVNNSGEGATWIDPQASAFREKIAIQNAHLLQGFMGGLASNGYAVRFSKRDMRQEFDEILDSQWTRGSYRKFPESKVVANIMRRSGIRNPISGVHTIERFVGFAREYGLGIAVERLLPDKIVSEMHSVK